MNASVSVLIVCIPLFVLMQLYMWADRCLTNMRQTLLILHKYMYYYIFMKWWQLLNIFVCVVIIYTIFLIHSLFSDIASCPGPLCNGLHEASKRHLHLIAMHVAAV